MYKWMIILLITLSACANEKVSVLTHAQQMAKVDSIVKAQQKLIKEEESEYLRDRLSIEVKVKTDSILEATKSKTAPSNVLPTTDTAIAGKDTISKRKTAPNNKLQNMKTILAALLFTLSFLPQNVQAQKIIYTDYAPYDVRNSNLSIVGKINGTLYAFRSYGKEYFLDAYNENMDKTATVVLDFFPEKIYNVRFIPFADKMMVLYQSQEGTRLSLIHI